MLYKLQPILLSKKAAHRKLAQNRRAWFSGLKRRRLARLPVRDVVIGNLKIALSVKVLQILGFFEIDFRIFTSLHTLEIKGTLNDLIKYVNRLMCPEMLYQLHLIIERTRRHSTGVVEYLGEYLTNVSLINRLLITSTNPILCKTYPLCNVLSKPNVTVGRTIYEIIAIFEPSSLDIKNIDVSLIFVSAIFHNLKVLVVDNLSTNSTDFWIEKIPQTTNILINDHLYGGVCVIHQVSNRKFWMILGIERRQFLMELLLNCSH